MNVFFFDKMNVFISVKICLSIINGIFTIIVYIFKYNVTKYRI